MKLYPLKEEIIPFLKRNLARLPSQNALAFRWLNNKLYPISDIDFQSFNSLQGIDQQKDKFRKNTEQFLQGLPANNILMTGARGTGKSTLIRAALHQYHKQNLRVVEVPFTELSTLPRLYQLLRQRYEKFIIFCDDLSFDREDAEFRALKSILDGSLERPAKNVLVYATSNRRHLMPDYYQDNDASEDLHPKETIDEKIALSDRFGLWLPFYSLDQETYLLIVKQYLEQDNIYMTEELRLKALQWAQQRGNRSGRLAKQFSQQIIGEA